MKKVIGIGFLGLGNVGSQLLTLIRENQKEAEEKYDIRFEVRTIYVRDVHKKRSVDVSGIHMTSNYEEVMNNPEIQICFECMGGAGSSQTYEMIMVAIKRGKHVIMASKKCLALYMNQIIEATHYYNVQLRFEATVGGAIPICKTLMNMPKHNTIYKMYGIVNATTNYVLTLMEQSHMDLETALRLAAEKGFAENDVAEDIEGWDATYKMSILARVGMQLDMACEKLIPLSLDAVNHQLSFKNIRQLFYLEKQKDNSLNYYVGPIELTNNHILCHVKNSDNMIFVESSDSGLRAFYGKGAGGKETASVMYEDLIDLLSRCYWFEPAARAECRQIDINESRLTLTSY